MMADKKVDRYRPERSADPAQQLKSALSNTGTINMADPTHDKGRSALLDRFRGREERWRREQSRRDREAAGMAGLTPGHGGAEAAHLPETKDADEGGEK